jgi:hypothetical protein
LNFHLFFFTLASDWKKNRISSMSC